MFDCCSWNRWSKTVKKKDLPWFAHIFLDKWRYNDDKVVVLWEYKWPLVISHGEVPNQVWVGLLWASMGHRTGLYMDCWAGGPKGGSLRFSWNMLRPFHTPNSAYLIQLAKFHRQRVPACGHLRLRKTPCTLKKKLLHGSSQPIRSKTQKLQPFMDYDGTFLDVHRSFRLAIFWETRQKPTPSDSRCGSFNFPEMNKNSQLDLRSRVEIRQLWHQQFLSLAKHKTL